MASSRASSYSVVLTTSAARELHGLPVGVVARMMPRLEHLASAPRPPGCKKLRGGDKEWRIRIGDYRIHFTADRAKHTVFVLRVLLRSEKSYR